MKRFARAALGGVIALGMLASVPATVFAAQPACGDTLMTDTKLTANLDCSGYTTDYALTVGHNKIVIDLNGHTITGPDGLDYLGAIDTNGYNRIVIKNGTIKNYTYPVYLNDSSRSKVARLTIIGEDDGSDYGIYNSGGSNNVIRKVDITNLYGALYSEYSADLLVEDSFFEGSTYGAYIYEDTHDTFDNNNFWGGTYSVYDYESHRQMYNANVANEGQNGFYMDCYGYGTVTMTDNVANNNSEYGFYLYECYGPNYTTAPGSTIVGNRANGNSTGFYTYSSYNEVWKNNVANDNDEDGFYFDEPIEAVIKKNVAKRNGDTGLEFVDNYSWYNAHVVSKNKANKNAYGIYAAYAVPGKNNITKNNTTLNCYNAHC